jgi:hypothetical protein
MKKKFSTIFLVFAISCFMILAIASTDDDTPVKETGGNEQQAATDDDAQQAATDGDVQQEANDERYVLGDTAMFRNINVTANEIIINDSWKDNQWSFFEPADGNIFVAVKFTIENTSDEDQHLSTILLFDAYADGIKLEFSFGAASDLEGTLDGSLSPGRKMVGYYGVEVSQNAEELELEVKSSWLGSGKAVFVFDVPKG